MGLAQPNNNLFSYGLLADQVPGANNYTMRLIDIDVSSNTMTEYDRHTFTGAAPSDWELVNASPGYLVRLASTNARR